MRKYQGGWIGGALALGKVAAVIGISLYIYKVGIDNGQSKEKIIGDKKYGELNDKYNQVHLDLSILNADAVVENAEKKAEFTTIGAETEVVHVTNKADIKAEADKYLNNLFIASGGMLGYPEAGSSLHTSEGKRRTLSSLALTLSDSCKGKRGLYGTLRRLDRELTTEINVPYNQCQEKLRDITVTSQKIDKEMELIRAENEANKKKIKEIETIKE